MAKHSKNADLLKVLAGKAPSDAMPAPLPHPEPTTRRSALPSPATHALRKAQPRVETPHPKFPEPIRGKAVQFYFHEQDQKLIHELSAWLASQRKRINDSLVLKTVLRAAKTGPELLAAYDAAIKVDGRTRKKPLSDTQ